MSKKKLLIIGGGNMGYAMGSGIANKKVYRKESIFFVEPSKERREFLRKNEFDSFSNLSNEIKRNNNKFDAIILAIKPNEMKEVLKELSQLIQNDIPIISIAAGIKINTISSHLNLKQPIARIMPNTPCLVGEGISAISYNKNISKNQKLLIKNIFLSIGQTLELEEKYLDSVTAVSGSGPAYFCYFLESLINGAIKQGLKSKHAKELVLQTALGTCILLKEKKLTPELLRKMVTSPKGTTEAGIKVFLNNDFKDIILKAIKAATRRANKLSRC